MKFRKRPIIIEAEEAKTEKTIHTLEGDMVANKGDWIVTGINGEKYPVKSDIFEKTYEKISETSGAKIEGTLKPIEQKCKNCGHDKDLHLLDGTCTENNEIGKPCGCMVFYPEPKQEKPKVSDVEFIMTEKHGMLCLRNEDGKLVAEKIKSVSAKIREVMKKDGIVLNLEKPQEKHFESLKNLSELKPLVECPDCGKAKIKADITLGISVRKKEKGYDVKITSEKIEPLEECPECKNCGLSLEAINPVITNDGKFCCIGCVKKYCKPQEKPSFEEVMLEEMEKKERDIISEEAARNFQSRFRFPIRLFPSRLGAGKSQILMNVNKCQISSLETDYWAWHDKVIQRIIDIHKPIPHGEVIKICWEEMKKLKEAV